MYSALNFKWNTDATFYCHNQNIISITVNCQSFKLQPCCKVIINMFMATELFDGRKDKLRKPFFFSSLSFFEPIMCFFSGKITANFSKAKPNETNLCLGTVIFHAIQCFTFFQVNTFPSFMRKVSVPFVLPRWKDFWSGKLFHDAVKFNQVHYIFYGSLLNQITWAQHINTLCFIDPNLSYAALLCAHKIQMLMFICVCWKYSVFQSQRSGTTKSWQVRQVIGSFKVSDKTSNSLLVNLKREVNEFEQ